MGWMLRNDPTTYALSLMMFIFMIAIAASFSSIMSVTVDEPSAEQEEEAPQPTFSWWLQNGPAQYPTMFLSGAFSLMLFIFLVYFRT